MEVKPTYLVMVSAANNNKYYNLFPEDNEFRVEYGRIDATKTITRYPINKWESQIKNKLKKGYVDVTDLKQDLVEDISSTNPDSPYKEIENKAIKAIVDKLQSLAKDTINRNYTVKASAVTSDMINAAQTTINELANNNSSVEEFNDILLKLFMIIPRRMGNVADYLASSKDDFGKIISKEQDLLDVMKGQVYIKPTVEASSPVDKKDKTILEEFGLVFEEVNRNDVALIKTLMNESASKFRNAWKVTNLQTQKRFDKFVKDNSITNTKLLFHGSRSENFWSIIKTGLVLRPTNAVITGKLYGIGIYFAPKAQKSIGYTSLTGSYWAGGSANTAYMAVMEVAYGTPYDVYDFDSQYYNLNYEKLQSYQKGANCLHAHAGASLGHSSLRNDEIVVYKEEQCTIKYLVEIGNN